MQKDSGKYYDVIVIGGGPAGMMAAGTAAEKGAAVLLLERMERPGRKLLITGKGRCNLTNVIPLSEFLKHTGPDNRFLRYSFSEFFSDDLIRFFNDIGIETITERGGRVFPASEKAADIVDALTRWIRKTGVEVITSAKAGELLIEENKIKGVKLQGGREYYGRNVVVCTGGKSYPATGSSGDGYIFAQQAGHRIIPPRQALVPVETSGNMAQLLQGLSLKNVRVNVWVDGKKTGDAFGEMLFTHFGLSGPIILTLSRQFNDDILARKKVIFSIDLKPALDDQKLNLRLLRDFEEHGKMQFSSLLKLFLPQKMIPIFMETLKIPQEKQGNQLSAEDRKRIRLLLKDFRFDVTGLRSFNEAVITAGGVDTKEVNPVTMESKIISGLYFAGEILNLDADTGGYNLQIAFSTGRMAGEHCFTGKNNEQ